jgi:beta-glucosidase
MRTTFVNLLYIVLFNLVFVGCKSDGKMIEQKRFESLVSFEEATEWADSIVNLMTLEEKVSLIGGDRIFFTNAIPRLGISAVMMADATQGVHLRDKWKDSLVYEQVLPRSTAFPSPILLASAWNKELAGKYAQAIGEECRAGGISVLLGPGMNIYRISQCGRNFEYFGEDPYLAGRMIENYVIALQNTGTIATLKHFVVNNTDYFRRKSNSIVDERTLHEIYTSAFKAGIDAGAMAVMTSYNLVNGAWCGQSDYVINDLLRKQLGFKWLVMTDWWSVYDGAQTIKSGQDLEMPYREATLNATELVEEGKVNESDIDRMVSGILRTLYAMDAFKRDRDTTLLDKFPEHEEIALQTAREGVVLLRNVDNILPIIDKNTKILLTGEYIDKIANGGGAAAVEGYNHIVLSDALAKLYGENLFINKNPSDEEISSADAVILNIGTFDSEGWDRSFKLPAEEEHEILRIAGLNPKTIVVVNSGSGINMSRWNTKVAAILFAWYPGQNGAEAIAEILVGKTSPSGKLPITIEKDFSDSPGFGYIPEGEELYSGWKNEEEKIREVYDVKYSEGVFVGYRWYEKQSIEPLYPFGFGLSYTSFAYSDLKVSKTRFSADDILKISFNITNKGIRTGSETAQLYIGDPEAAIPRPIKELKGFEKVLLAPGEKKRISLLLDRSAFSYWYPKTKTWTAEPGKFIILVGSSSADIHLQEEVELY